MLKILFDNVEIDSKYIMALSRNNALFDDEFKLGSVASASYSISISKTANISTPTSCVVQDDNTILATLVLDNVNTNNNKYNTYEFTDGMVNFDFNYSAKEIIEQQGGSATLLQIVQDMCSKANITLATTTFNCSTMPVSWYDNTIQARTYISYVAELNGGYAQINNLGQLEFLQFSNTSVANIQANTCESIKLGEYHQIKRVVYDNGTITYAKGDATGETIYLDTTNTFFTDSSGTTIEAQVEAIKNAIYNYEYHSVELGKFAHPNNVRAGQKVSLVNGANSYPLIYTIQQNYNTQWVGGMKCELHSEKINETKPQTLSSEVRTIKVTVNRQEGQIQQVVTDMAETTQNVNALSDDVDTLTTQTTQLTQTSEQLQLDVITNTNSINGLTEMTTTITGNANGITVQVEGSDIKSNMYNDGFRVLNGNNEVMSATQEGVKANNLIVDGEWSIDTLNNGNVLAFYRR